MRKGLATLYISLLAVSGFFSGCAAPLSDNSLSGRSEYSFIKEESPKSASYLVDLCAATDSDKLSYCEGYLDGAIHYWKFSTSCSSSILNDQYFCEGVIAAREKLQQVLEACRDCDFAEFQPDLKDESFRSQLFTKRMQVFQKELKTELGVCTLDEYHEKPYCLGYNEEVANITAEFSIIFPEDFSKSARDLGLGDAAGDVSLHLMASEKFYEMQPCLEIMTEPYQVRNILLTFVHNNPEQQKETTAIELLATALFYELCPGPAKGLKPHREQCTTWDYEDDQLRTKNFCDEAVVIQFMSEGQSVIERQLNPGMTFYPGINRSQKGWWMFTVCPVGYVSSIPFHPENRHILIKSQYSCVKK